MNLALAANDRGDSLIDFDRSAEYALDHEQRLPCPAALVVVRRGEHVLVVYDRWKQRWELPGGARERGESPRAAAVRELAEESGIDDEKLIFAGVGTVRLAPDQRKERLAVFSLTVQEDPIPDFVANKEIAELRWWDPSEPLNDLDPIDAKLAELADGSYDGRFPNDITQQSYQRSAELYIERTPGVGGPRKAFLDHVQREVGVDGSVLEIGSGPGADADYLEAGGLTVQRTDVTPAFVDRLRAAGHRAERLDVRVDDLGGPWDAVFANAVLLHLTREDFTAAVERIRIALRPGGLFAFTLKAGAGEGWSERKLQQPRYFVYWTADGVRAVLVRTGWSMIEVTQPDYPDGSDPWLHVVARP